MAKKIQSQFRRRQIRIIGGKWRGRKLSIVDNKNLRPTTDRVRETLFNWLMPVIHRSRCLDCFSGSGALGIEALSHNASTATLIELERSIALQLISNLAKLKIKNAQVFNKNALHYLNQIGTSYDIIFLDPPFGKNLLKATSSLLEKNGWLGKNCWIYVEAEVGADLSIFPKNWNLQKKKIAGKVSYSLYTRY